VKKTILYLGEDPDFTTSLKKLAVLQPETQVFFASSGPGNLLRECLQRSPHIIYLEIENSFLIEEICFLRRIPAFKSILLIGICNDEESAIASEIFLVSGVNFFHIKDTDTDGLFEDSQQLAFESARSPGDFARAKKLNIPLKIKLHGALTKVSKSSFVIETDIELNSCIDLNLPMNSECPPVKVEVTTGFPGGFRGNFIQSYEMKYPYPGPWDPPSTEHLDPATVETWLDLKAPAFDSKKNNVIIFSRNTESMIKVRENSDAVWFHFFTTVSEALGCTYLSKPGMIIFDLHTKEGPDLQQLGELIGNLKEITPSPIITVFDSPSESEALQKLYSYDFILSIADAFSVNMYKLMEKKFLEKKGSIEEEHFIHPADADKLLNLPVAVTLTSLTERDLTFLVDQEIPYFATAKLTLPIPAFVTVIPAEGQLPAVRNKKHYRALIHGIEEISLANLRKIVNQLIFLPVEELTEKVVETMLKQDYLTKEETVEKEVAGTKIPEQSLSQEPEAKGLTPFRRYLGVSKL
jgi:hypothetical protein